MKKVEITCFIAIQFYCIGEMNSIIQKYPKDSSSFIGHSKKKKIEQLKTDPLPKLGTDVKTNGFQVEVNS